MRTDALLLDRDLELVLGSREIDPPLPGEVLVRVAWAGVCGSDLHVLASGAWVAYWPATLGHEVAGVVEACPGGEIRPGTAVVVDSRLPCGKCPGCSQAPSLCHNMTWLGESRPGGFARWLVVPVASVVACPEGTELAVAVLAEPLSVAMHAVSRLPAPPAGPALVLGYGPVGALVHLELVRRWPGLAVFVSEPNAERAELARALGAQVVAAPAPGAGGTATSETVVAGGDGAPGGHRFALVVDAAGYPQSLATALRAVANGGTVLVVALNAQAVPLVPSELAERAISIVGCIGFDAELPEAVRVLASAPDRYRPLVTEAVLLEEAAGRLAELGRQPSVGKVVVRPWRD